MSALKEVFKLKALKTTIVALAMVLLLAQNAAAYSSSDVNTWNVEKEIYYEVNDERTSRGLNAFDYNPALSQVARQHSDRMAERGSLFHTSGLLSTFRDAGVSCNFAAENVAYTWHVDRTDEEVADRLVSQWMNSAGHRHNILNDNYNQEGLGVTVVGPYVVATQNFCN